MNETFATQSAMYARSATALYVRDSFLVIGLKPHKSPIVKADKATHIKEEQN